MEISAQDKLEHVLVSPAAELTGHKETVRNELWSLFKIWMPWEDTTLPKDHMLAHDAQQRAFARIIYVKKLYERGVTVDYFQSSDRTDTVRVSVDGKSAHHVVKVDGRRAARSAFVRLMNSSSFTITGIIPRPRVNPSTWPVRESAGFFNNSETVCIGESYGLSSTNETTPRTTRVTDGGKGGGTAGSGDRGKGGGGGERATAAQGGGAAQGSGGAGSIGGASDASVVKEPESVALLFITNGDVRNSRFWKCWLESAPCKSYTIYVHSKDPSQLSCDMFRDNVIQQQVSPFPDSSIFSGGRVETLLALLNVATLEAANKWFIVLDEACLPLIGFSTMYESLLSVQTSMVSMHKSQVQQQLLKGLARVAEDLGPHHITLRDAICNNDLQAHSVVGMLLTSRDALALVALDTFSMELWSQPTEYEALGGVLIGDFQSVEEDVPDVPCASTPQLAHTIPIESAITSDFDMDALDVSDLLYPEGGLEGEDTDMLDACEDAGLPLFAAPLSEAPAPISKVFVLPEELFVVAYLRRFYRSKAQEFLFTRHALVHSKCCLNERQCTCAISRPLRLSTYSLIMPDFLRLAMRAGSFFGAGFENITPTVLVHDLQLLWWFDMDIPSKVATCGSLFKGWLPGETRHKDLPMPVSLPLLPLDTSEGVCTTRYPLTRHDVGRMVDIILKWAGEPQKVVRGKLRMHIPPHTFRVEMLESNAVQHLDMSRLDYQMVPRKPAVSFQVLFPSTMARAKDPALHKLGPLHIVTIGRGLIFKDYSAKAQIMLGITVKATSMRRLYALYLFLCKAEDEGFVSRTQSSTDDLKGQCVLGFSSMQVKQPDFNQAVRLFVSTGTMWKNAPMQSESMKPTWAVYEMFRQIGVSPVKYTRGPKESDPGSKDFLYAERYYFRQEIMEKNRVRLTVDGIAKGNHGQKAPAITSIGLTPAIEGSFSPESAPPPPPQASFCPAPPSLYSSSPVFKPPALPQASFCAAPPSLYSSSPVFKPPALPQASFCAAPPSLYSSSPVFKPPALPQASFCAAPPSLGSSSPVFVPPAPSQASFCAAPPSLALVIPETTTDIPIGASSATVSTPLHTSDTSEMNGNEGHSITNSGLDSGPTLVTSSEGGGFCERASMLAVAPASTLSVSTVGKGGGLGVQSTFNQQVALLLEATRNEIEEKQQTLVGIIAWAACMTSTMPLHSPTQALEKSHQVSEMTARALEKSSQVPEMMARALEKSPQVPEMTARALEKSPQVPEMTARALEKSPQVPEMTARALEKSPQVPEMTARALEKSPQVPEMTARALEKSPQVPAGDISCDVNIRATEGSGGVGDGLTDAVLALLNLASTLPARRKYKQKRKLENMSVAVAAGEQEKSTGDAVLGMVPTGEGGAVKLNVDDVLLQIDAGQLHGFINENSRKRLKSIFHTLVSCEKNGLISFERSDEEGGDCILGWRMMLVSDPAALNAAIRNMVDLDSEGIWKKANGKYNMTLKNPTWGSYELFRKIGVKPRFRGPASGDPGKKDMFYYMQWEFKDDESYKNARQRLQTGYSYCPERGNRERKRGQQRAQPTGAAHSSGLDDDAHSSGLDDAAHSSELDDAGGIVSDSVDAI